MKKSIKYLLIFFLFFIFYFLVLPYKKFINNQLNISIIKTLIGKDNLKTYNNQVNILILGIAGSDHEGPNLSDSITIANYNFEKNKLTTISIPRDIWSDTLENKINSAYAFGEAKKPNKGGIILAKAEVQAIVGLPIQYAAVINFNKFVNLIDFLGGIDVKVENSFVDKKYPIQGKENDLCNGDPEYSCRYETISFKKGLNHMDGKTTLKFVRSRYAEGDEGTDFARIKRQQKVIEALQKKVIELIKTFKLKNYEQLYEFLDNNIKRDITNQQIAIIFKNIILKNNFQINKIILDENLFINPNYEDYNGMWVLIPKNKDYSLIQKYIKDKL